MQIEFNRLDYTYHDNDRFRAFVGFPAVSWMDSPRRVDLHTMRAATWHRLAPKSRNVIWGNELKLDGINSEFFPAPYDPFEDMNRPEYALGLPERMERERRDRISNLTADEREELAHIERVARSLDSDYSEEEVQRMEAFADLQAEGEFTQDELDRAIDSLDQDLIDAAALADMEEDERLDRLDRAERAEAFSDEDDDGGDMLFDAEDMNNTADEPLESFDPLEYDAQGNDVADISDEVRWEQQARASEALELAPCPQCGKKESYYDCNCAEKGE